MTALHRSSALVAALVLALSPLACDDAGSTGPAGETASVTVLLTDDPGDLVHAWVDVREVYLQGGDAEGRLVLFEGPTGPIDLLTLVDEFRALTADIEIPAGSYGQLRMVIDGAAVVTEAGETFATEGFAAPGVGAVDGELACPSCDATGIKVLLRGRDLDLVDDPETLILDFEVDESFVRPAGRSGRWMLRPTIELFGNPEDAAD